LASRHGCVETCAFLGRSEGAIFEKFGMERIQCVVWCGGRGETYWLV
jgi:hypothetical protein